MKEKWSVHILPMLLCMVMLCSIPAHAMEARASTRIAHSTVTLSKKSNGDFSIFFSVQGVGKMDVIGASSVEVQRNTIFGWVTEYTFTTSDTPEIQSESKFQHNATLTYSPLFEGKEYRAVVMIYVKDASGVTTQRLESKTLNS